MKPNGVVLAAGLVAVIGDAIALATWSGDEVAAAFSACAATSTRLTVAYGIWV